MAEVTYVRADGERRTPDVPDGTSQPNSRLACQLIASGVLDGIVVHTPEAQL